MIGRVFEVTATSDDHAESGTAARPAPGVAFLLTQLGTLAAGRFAERVGELDLSPPQVGLLRMIGVQPGLSQQALAARLGLLPSKVVSFVDDLEQRGVVQRTRSKKDRRVYELELTAEGTALLGRVREVAAAHESEFCAALDGEEHAELRALLRRLADSHELTPGVHPGYRHLR